MWPIVRVTISNELLSSDVDYLHQVCDQVFAAEERHAFLVDCSDIRKPPGASIRRKLKEFEDSRQLVSAKKGIACAIVFHNAIVRGAYTALRWISAQPVPNRAFGTSREAAAWCIDAIERDGAPVPAAAYALAGRQVATG